MTTVAPIRSIASIPAHARVWVYKAKRTLSQAEQRFIREKGAEFCAAWAGHGAPLDAAVDVVHDRFVVVAVDEQQANASGCSIDKSVGFIKDLEFQLNIMLTDRMVIVFDTEDGTRSCDLKDLPGLLADGTLNGDTFIFDDLVSTKGDLDDRFRVQLRSSWLSRYL